MTCIIRGELSRSSLSVSSDLGEGFQGARSVPRRWGLKGTAHRDQHDPSRRYLSPRSGLRIQMIRCYNETKNWSTLQAHPRRHRYSTILGASVINIHALIHIY